MLTYLCNKASLMYKAPIPLGPKILCAERERKSIFNSSTSILLLDKIARHQHEI